MTIDKVIKNGYCSGCGACCVISPSCFSMKFDRYGQLTARISKDADYDGLARADRVCPFSDNGENEDTISDKYYPDADFYNPAIGKYLSCFAGHVKENKYREQGSSGGLITWLLCHLLKNEYVDGIIHVRKCIGQAENSSVLFEYMISSSIEEVQLNPKSCYYPITLSQILKYVKTTPGRYAITGIPCFIKAIRLLQENDRLIGEKIVYTIGLVCGHLKSRKFADLLSWQCGVALGRIHDIDFRRKLPRYSANQYAVWVKGEDFNGELIQKTVPMKNLIGGDWGIGYFKYKACGFCDDVFAETADIVVGDAWLPQYIKDHQGTNIIVVRNKTILKIFLEAIRKGQIAYEEIDVNDVVRSQDAGLRDRRSGLAYRLYMKAQHKEWHPQKRVTPHPYKQDKWFRMQQEKRESLQLQIDKSFDRAVANDSFDIFKSEIEKYVSDYYAHNNRLMEILHRMFKKKLYSIKKKIKLSVEWRYER